MSFYTFLQIITSSLLLYLSFPNILTPNGYWATPWIFAVPLFFALEKKAARQRFAIGILFGIFSFGLLARWMFSVSIPGALLFIFLLSLQPILFCLFYPGQAHDSLWKIFLPGALWVSFELSNQTLFGGFSWGLGYSQAFYPVLAQTASLTGTQGISFILITFNYCLFLFLSGKKERKSYLWIMLALFLLTSSYGLYRLHSRSKTEKPAYPLHILLIQANISPEEKTNPDLLRQGLEKHIDLTEGGLSQISPELIIWPETAIPDDLFFDNELYEGIQQLSQKANSYLLIGAALYKEDHYSNSAVLFDPQMVLRGRYDKKHLVPFVEYAPKQKWLGPLYQKWGIHAFDFIPGKKPHLFKMTTHSGKAFRFGVAICSEDFYPGLFRRQAVLGADFMAVLLNDGWFHHPETLRMHLQGSVMRAIETGLPIARSSNTGITCFINQYGKIKLSPPLLLKDKNPAARGMRTQSTRTFYTVYGYIFPFLCLFFVIIFLIISIRKKRNPRVN